MEYRRSQSVTKPTATRVPPELVASLSLDDRPRPQNLFSEANHSPDDEERPTTPVIQVDMSPTKSDTEESLDFVSQRVSYTKRDSLQLPKPLEIATVAERGATAGEMSPPPSPASPLVTPFLWTPRAEASSPSLASLYSNSSAESWPVGESFESRYTQCIERRHSVAVPIPWIKLTPPESYRRGSLGEENNKFPQPLPMPCKFSLEGALTGKGALGKLKRVPRKNNGSSVNSSPRNGRKPLKNEYCMDQTAPDNQSLSNSKQRKLSISSPKLQDLDNEKSKLLPDIKFKEVTLAYKEPGKLDLETQRRLSRSACNLAKI